jgi:hypothetical protein
MDMESMYRATLKLVIVGETLNSWDIGVRHGMMIAEPIGDATAARATVKVIIHFVLRGYRYGCVTSGTMVKRASRPRLWLRGTFGGYDRESFEDIREIWRDILGRSDDEWLSA